MIRKGSRLRVALSSAMVWVLALALLAGCASTQPQPKQAAQEQQPKESAPASAGPKEAPALAKLVSEGKLPALAERLPKNPAVVKPTEKVGTYGGVWRMGTRGRSDGGMFAKTVQYEPYVRWTTDLKGTAPNVMAKWNVSPDAKVYTFTLREGMKWSDGKPFTADDILFWYEIRQDPAINAVIRDDLVVTKVDNLTVKFEWKTPNGLFLQRLAGPNMGWYLPAHYLKEFHPRYNKAKSDEEIKKRQVQDFKALWALLVNPLDNPELPVITAWKVVTGFGAGQQVVLERNPYYWKVDTDGNQLPYLDKVVFEIHEDVNTMVLKGLNGEIDAQDRHIDATQNKSVFFDGQQKGNYKLYETFPSNMNTAVIALNLTHKDPVLQKIFQDKRFRMALSHAINRKEVIDTVFVGQGEPWQVGPPQQSPFYNEKLAKQFTEYDVSKANALLDEMGLTKRDGNGVRLRPDGKPLVFNLEIASSGPGATVWPDIAQLVEKFWAAVGVDMNVKVIDRSLFYTRKEANEHDAGVWGGDGGLDSILEPRWFFPFRNESLFAVPWADWFATQGKAGEEPTLASVRKQMDLYRQLEQTGDPAKQDQLMKEIIAIAQEEFWVMGISLPAKGFGIVRNDFHNVPQSQINAWLIPQPGVYHPEQFYSTRK